MESHTQRPFRRTSLDDAGASSESQGTGGGVGHLVRKLSLLQTLVFDRPGHGRLLLTLVGLGPGRAAVSLASAGLPPVLVALHARHSGGMEVRVSADPERVLLTFDPAESGPIRLAGQGEGALWLSVGASKPDELTIELESPGVGHLGLAFVPKYDKVRLDVFADRGIRVYPGP